MILGEIKRYLRDGNSLRVSRSIRDTAYKVLKTREKLEEEDKEATIEKIAEAMQVQQKEVVYALDAISDPVSLFDPVYNKAGDTLMLMDQIYDEKNNDEVWTEHAALSEACSCATTRAKRRRRSPRRSASRRRRSRGWKRTPSAPSAATSLTIRKNFIAGKKGSARPRKLRTGAFQVF